MPLTLCLVTLYHYYQIFQVTLFTSLNPLNKGSKIAGSRGGGIGRRSGLKRCHQLIDKFVSSRASGLSPKTIYKSYLLYLNRSREVVGVDITAQQLQHFINSRPCSQGGKAAYYRVLRCFYRWLYSPKSGLDLRPEDNPITRVEAPRVPKRIMPSLNVQDMTSLVESASTIRDKAIISLFSDTGLRLAELSHIKIDNIDFNNRIIKVKIKGGREAYATFGARTKSLLEQYLAERKNNNGYLWDCNENAIVWMLRKLERQTGIKCNAHAFRRGFASELARRGVDILHIQRLGRWQSLSMVQRYTESVQFQDALKFYEPIVS